jgi:hypothetical protein
MSSTLRRRTAITRTMVILLVVLPLLLPLLLRQWGNLDVAIMVAEAFHPTYNAAPSSAFLVSTSSRPGQSRTITTTTTTQMRTQTKLFCICVDCKWVTSCKAYHFVEKKHEQPHMSEEPTFLPREGSPTINVNIRTEQRKPKAGVDKTDDAVARMWKDQIQEENDDEQGDGNIGSNSESEPKRDARYYEEMGTIEAVNTNTTTTIEYDVVKCADFVLDKGCWIRNMPEEIKRVNPDFVPT